VGKKYQQPYRKVVDEEHVWGKRTGPKLRMEVWEDADGNVAKYNLAYIDTSTWSGDNGRLLGYDNNHDHHHRHFMGTVEEVAFTSFEDLVLRFQFEVVEMGKKK